ncbi:MAG TPA: aldehyde dehydrogenase family protein, partial [Acidobacteria bacterium]|nr:aldehyde dehydrogenase family protein [Acidobacteriota bacterium]
MSDIKKLLESLGIEEVNHGAYAGEWFDTEGGRKLVSINPTTGEPIATVIQAGADAYEKVVERAEEAFKTWRMMPA